MVAETVVPHMATRLMAMAFCGDRLKARIRVGTRMKPPPRPHMDAGKPTIKPSPRSTKNRKIVIMGTPDFRPNKLMELYKCRLFSITNQEK
jgi:hypothetical protein